MTWLSLAIGLIIALPVIAYVARPLFTPARLLYATDDSRLGDLLARKDTVLSNIKEIEFDHQTGKLNTEDYTQYNQRLRGQALSLLKRIDQIAPGAGDLDTQLEAAIAARRKVAAAPVSDAAAATAASVTEIAGTDDATTKQATEAGGAKEVVMQRSASFCHHCGAPVEPGDRFCRACGTRLREE